MGGSWVQAQRRSLRNEETPPTFLESVLLSQSGVDSLSPEPRSGRQKDGP